MKKLFGMIRDNMKIRRSLVFLSVAVIVCCIGVINNRIQSSSLGVSAGYDDYEAAEMEKHNGEVLVDSLNITQMPGSPDGSNKAGSSLDASDASKSSESSVKMDTIETSAEGSEKNSAEEQRSKLLEYMEMEKSVESLIRNKGFTDAFVLITDRSVNVTVQAETLSDRDAAKILDIVIRETGRSVDDVVIQAKAV